MEVQKRQKYSKEYREDVLNMLKTGEKDVSALSKELGIAKGIIYRWYRKSKGSREGGSEKISDKDKEIRELRAKLAEVSEERDILKKAVHIFSKKGPPK